MTHKRSRKRPGRSRTRPRQTRAEEESDRLFYRDAGLVLETVNRFPVFRNYLGEISLENNAVGAELERFEDYYNLVEMTLLEEAERCPCRGTHKTLDADEYWLFILSQMVERLRTLIGASDQVDALWMPIAGTKSCVNPKVPWLRRPTWA